MKMWSEHQLTSTTTMWEVWSHQWPGPHPKPTPEHPLQRSKPTPGPLPEPTLTPLEPAKVSSRQSQGISRKCPVAQAFETATPCTIFTEHVHDQGLGYSNRSYTLQRCTTLPTIHGLSSGTGSRRNPYSLPKVSSLESAARPLQSFELARAAR